MPFNSGTGITDQIDMLDKLLEVISSRYLESVAVNAGGTGHAIGDIIEIDATGSTSTIVAQLEVTSVAAGVIDGIRVYRAGAYTVDPTTTTANAQSGTSGVGIGATFDLTMHAASWAVNRRTQQALSAAVGTAGNGYNIGDILTPTGGVFGDVDGAGTQGVAGTFTVATLTGGAGTGVATVTLTTAGNYEETPANDAATTNDGTGDDACTLTITYEDPAQTDTDFQVAMLQGEGLAGADAIHVMIRSFSQANGFDTAFNWQLLGATGYNNSLPIHTQTGVDTTQINQANGALPVTDRGSYLVLKDNDADPDMEWWINHNGRRIIIVCKVEGGATTHYMSAYMGFLNQTATDTEWPYPLWICGCTSDINRIWTDASLLTGGVVEVITALTGDPLGPGYLRLPSGIWQSFVSAASNSASIRTIETEWCIYPFANPGVVSGVNALVTNLSHVDWSGGVVEIIPALSVPGAEDVLLKPTPGTGDDYYWLVAPIVFRQETSQFPTLYNMYGEIDGVFWFNRGGNAIVSLDRFVLGTKRYLIFQNGNRTQNWSYFAMDED